MLIGMLLKPGQMSHPEPGASLPPVPLPQRPLRTEEAELRGHKGEPVEGPTFTLAEQAMEVLQGALRLCPVPGVHSETL